MIAFILLLRPVEEGQPSQTPLWEEPPTCLVPESQKIWISSLKLGVPIGLCILSFPTPKLLKMLWQWLTVHWMVAANPTPWGNWLHLRLFFPFLPEGENPSSVVREHRCVTKCLSLISPMWWARFGERWVLCPPLWGERAILLSPSVTRLLGC